MHEHQFQTNLTIVQQVKQLDWKKNNSNTKHPLIRNVPYRKVVASINFLYKRALRAEPKTIHSWRSHSQNDMSASATQVAISYNKYECLHIGRKNLQTIFVRFRHRNIEWDKETSACHRVKFLPLAKSCKSVQSSLYIAV